MDCLINNIVLLKCTQVQGNFSILEWHYLLLKLEGDKIDKYSLGTCDKEDIEKYRANHVGILSCNRVKRVKEYAHFRYFDAKNIY